MTHINLDKVIQASSTTTTGGGAADYETTIDGALDLYSAQVKNYPVANAFTLGGVESQEFWGLQNITARAGQNTQRQGRLSYGIAQGTGNLSRHSIVPFSRTIKNITSGNVTYALYFDLDSVTYDGAFDVSGKDTAPEGMFMSSDGTKGYVVGNATESIHQYTLSTARDWTGTVTYDGAFDVSGQDTTPAGVFMSSDGTKGYMVGNSEQNIYQYTLTTARDWTGTVTYDGAYSVVGQDTSPNGMFMSSDGTKGYMVGTTNDNIYQYILTTAWDWTGTVTYDGAFDVGGKDTVPNGMFMSSDGTKGYVVGNATDSIHQYTLSTARDWTGTVTYDGAFDVGGKDADPHGMFMSSDGTKGYMVGIRNDKIYQYTLPTTTTTVDLTLSVNGSVVDADSVDSSRSRLRPTIKSVSLTNINISDSSIDFEIATNITSNPDNINMKLGFGLNGGDYDTPTGNYETSTLNLTL